MSIWYRTCQVASLSSSSDKCFCKHCSLKTLNKYLCFLCWRLWMPQLLQGTRLCSWVNFLARCSASRRTISDSGYLRSECTIAEPHAMFRSATLTSLTASQLSMSTCRMWMLWYVIHPVQVLAWRCIRKWWQLRKTLSALSNAKPLKTNSIEIYSYQNSNTRS